MPNSKTTGHRFSEKRRAKIAEEADRLGVLTWNTPTSKAYAAKVARREFGRGYAGLPARTDPARLGAAAAAVAFAVGVDLSMPVLA